MAERAPEKREVTGSTPVPTTEGVQVSGASSARRRGRGSHSVPRVPPSAGAAAAPAGGPTLAGTWCVLSAQWHGDHHVADARRRAAPLCATRSWDRRSSRRSRPSDRPVPPVSRGRRPSPAPPARRTRLPPTTCAATDPGAVEEVVDSSGARCHRVPDTRRPLSRQTHHLATAAPTRSTHTGWQRRAGRCRAPDTAAFRNSSLQTQ